MVLDERHWDRIQKIFHHALARPAGEREDYVRGECADEPALAAQVLAMLEADARTTSPLDRDLAGIAHELLDGSVPRLERIGPYRIVGVAGRGGMGVVYEAVRDDLGSRAAIKVLRDATLSPMRRERFASEQRVLASLEHPSIARLYDADTLPDGTPYFVMEYVDGLSLTEHATAWRLTVRQRLELFREVCAGVQYAHSAAVVHRDIKPSNILVRTDGAVKLLDFGIAKQLEGLDAAADRTQTAFRMMTPAYAAPEQLAGGPLGTFTDVYSLGVVLYELLTGRPPFDASALTPGQLETAILESQTERPSRAARNSPAAASDAARLGASAWADLDILCGTAMHREPERRYRTVDALVRDIDRFLARQPLEARGDSAMYRIDRFLRRNARVTAAAALAIMLLIGMSGFYTMNLAAARDHALLESARAQQTQTFLLNLFEGGDATLGPTDSLRVVALLDRGLEEARQLDRQPGLQASLYATLGEIYHQLGDFARADSLLTLSLSQRRSLLGEVHPDIATNLVALGQLREAQAEVDEAERLIREGLAMSRAAQPPRTRDVASALTALGELLRDRGAHDEAIGALDEAIRLYGPEPTPELARAMAALAGTYFYTGDYPVSDSLNRTLLELRRGLHGTSHPHVANVLINLGAIQFERGRHAEAEALYRQSLEIKLAFYGEDNHQIAANRTMLGRALNQQERYDEALAQLAPALRVRERVFGGDHPAVASTLNDLGIVYLAAGDLEGAEASFRRMLDIYDEVYGGAHAFSGIAMSNLANVHVEAGDYGQAAELLARAVEQFTNALGPEHSNTAIGLIKLGGALRQLGRWADARQNLEAGYDILSAQVDPAARFLQIARRDLADVHQALGDAAEAERWRAEYAALQP